MAALKWSVVVVFGLGALGALGMGVTSTGAPRQPILASAVPVSLRAWPVAMVGIAPAPATAEAEAKPTSAAPPPEVVQPPEPSKPPEVAKPVEVAKPQEPAKPVAKPPEPVKVAAPAPKPEPAKPQPEAAEPEPVEPKPEPVAETAKPEDKPAEAPKPEPAKEPAPVAAKPPAPPPADGLLNLTASETADVYLDGKKLGGSPLMGVKARAGTHKVRFDCYDAAGNTLTGTAQSVVVKADAEVDVNFPCPQE